MNTDFLFLVVCCAVSVRATLEPQVPSKMLRSAEDKDPHQKEPQPLPEPQKCAKEWPVWLLFGVLGYYFTYFWGLGRP